MMTDDHRTTKTAPWGYVVCTDTFMSGWGKAPGRSLYALAVDSASEAQLVIENARRRTDMKRPRVVRTLRADGTPRVRVYPGDHLSVVDRGEAAAWYRKGAFAR